MSIPKELQNPTQPELEENRGPLCYDYTIGQNDVDVGEAAEDGVGDDEE